MAYAENSAASEEWVGRLSGTHALAGYARAATLVASDIAALSISGGLALVLWAQPVRGQELSLYLPAAPFVFIFLLAYAQAGLYPGFGLGPVETLRRYLVVTAAVFMGLAALIFILKIDDVYSRVTLVLAMTFSLLALPLARTLTLRLARRWHWWAEPVVLLGYDDRTAHAQERLHRQAGEFRAVATLIIPSQLTVNERDRLELLAVCQNYVAGGVRVAFADTDDADVGTVAGMLMLVFPRVVMLRDYDELPVEGVQVRNFGGVLGLEYGNNLLRRQSRWVKRTLDIVLGTMLLLASLPVMLVAMFSVKLLSPGPALFWQVREGHRSKSIRVPKIRTMVVDAEYRMEELLQSDAELRAEWQAGFKLRRDPRVIPAVGAILRRFSVDELPQLWSVIRGDMSLVGPRPFPDYHLDALSQHVRRLRDEVRPGITGLWQVTSRGDADVQVQQSQDVYYIRNWSLWLDLYILARTFSAVLSGRGAY